MKSHLSLFLIFFVVCNQSGCSMFVSDKQEITIKTSEEDAAIYIQGELVGQGEVTRAVMRNKDVYIYARKPGFQQTTKTIGTKFSVTGLLDLVGGMLITIPYLGLFSAGARELEETEVSLYMRKEES